MQGHRIHPMTMGRLEARIVTTDRNRTLVLGALLLVLVATVPSAAARADGLGPRVGLTADPDQVHFGLHLPTLTMAPNLGFMASFEAGVGDDSTLLAANLDFKYVFDAHAGSWRPYAGAGPAMYVFNSDYDDDVEVGAGVFGGMQTPTRAGAFFGEMRVGLVDSPDVKFTVGWMFH